MSSNTKRKKTLNRGARKIMTTERRIRNSMGGCAPLLCCRQSVLSTVVQREAPEGNVSVYSECTVFHDASEGGSFVSEPFDQEFFFDAPQSDDYPIITTSYVQKMPKTTISMKDPKSLLRTDKMALEVAQRPLRPDHQNLEYPRVSIIERGYPGQLSIAELEECIKFYDAVEEDRKTGGVMHEIVYHYSDIEEQPYALCRFMRGSKFDADKMLDRLRGDSPIWKEAKAKEFFPNVEEAIGVPFDVFATVYPFFWFGNAKNGCPVSYFTAGRLNVQGVMCLTTVDRLPGFYWHGYVHKFRHFLKKAQEKDSDFVRCESVNVVDLKGMSASQATSEAMEVIKIMSKISDFFPETLQCMLILNVPSWFSVTWQLIKRFIDPRTASKIEVYSSSARGQQRLMELIDISQVPAEFGGEGPSATGRADGDRKLAKVLTIGARGGTNTFLFRLEANESVSSLRIYTKSTSMASFSLRKRGRGEAAIQSVEVDQSSTHTELSADIQGPGHFVLEGKETGDGSSSPRTRDSAQSFFLIVGTVHQGETA